jgi:hypothetical protein
MSDDDATERSTASPPAADGIDYTSAENAGKLHPGDVADAEAAWVRANRDKASKNRQSQTGKPIDWNDPKERERYALKARHD